MNIVRGYFSVFQWIRNQLDTPFKVLLFCIFLFTMTLLSNGLWWKLWAMNRDQQNLIAQMEETRESMQELDQKLKMTQDLGFIERQAKERLDLVDENDLVFVFPEG